MAKKLPSDAEADVLRLLLTHGEMFGLELVRASGGRVKRAGIYVLLERLRAAGFVDVREAEPSPEYVGITRRLYSVNGLGQRALRAKQAAQDVLDGTTDDIDGLVTT